MDMAHLRRERERERVGELMKKSIDWILTTPVLGSFAPLLKVEAKVEEHDSS